MFLTDTPLKDLIKEIVQTANDQKKKKKSCSIRRTGSTTQRKETTARKLSFPHEFNKVSLMTEIKIITLSGTKKMIFKHRKGKGT